VCAGAKSVLDLPKTLEALETLAVPVLGVATREFPAFYCVRSGLRLAHEVSGAEEGARVARARLSQGSGGLVLALPPPAQTALDPAEVEGWVAQASEKARAAGIHGKAVTPYLLGELVQASGGRALTANVALLEHNARFAAELALHLASTGGAKGKDSSTRGQPGVP
jgi:pseudouridine-5'-phosphate glycosidase